MKLSSFIYIHVMSFATDSELVSGVIASEFVCIASQILKIIQVLLPLK